MDVSTPATSYVVDTLPLSGEPIAIVTRGGYAYILVEDAMALVRLNGTGTPMVVDYFFPYEGYSTIALGDDMVILGAENLYDLTLAQSFQSPGQRPVQSAGKPGGAPAPAGK